MQVLNVEQGTAEWLALRPSYCVASEAPVIMGDGRHTSRAELIRAKRTGDEREFSKWEQEMLLAKGHKAEEMARAAIEALVGESLPPVVGVSDCGRYLASFDGLSDDRATVFEAKLWNAELADAIRRDDIPPAYYWQLEHQMMVAGAGQALFCCCREDGTGFEWMTYEPVPGRRAQLVAGWDLFLADLAAWQPAAGAAPAAPVVAAAPAPMPVLTVELQGRVVSSNLAAWSEIVSGRIAEIRTDLQTDEDFATAKETVKFLAEAEARVDVVKSAALAQTASIDDLFRTLDSLREQMRAKRLNLAATVAAREKRIREEILADAIGEFSAFCSGEKRGLPARFDFRVKCDIGAAMKGKRTVATLREAAQNCVAQAKIVVADIAGRARANLDALPIAAAGRSIDALAPDLHELLHKETQDFDAIIAQRIAAADAEAAKAAEKAAERAAEKAGEPPAPRAGDPAPRAGNGGAQSAPTPFPPASAGLPRAPGAAAVDRAAIRAEVCSLLDSASDAQAAEILASARMICRGEAF